MRFVGPCFSLVFLLAASIALSAERAPLSALAAQRLDPRLQSALVEGSPPASVWVEFVDKGEAGPSDLVRRLAAAEAALTPESRRRRERNHVEPLVDWLDLPVNAPYVEALRASGLKPYGASRWFNRVAVRTSGAALASLAEQPFVRRVSPVERALLSRSPVEVAPEEQARRAVPAAIGATNVLDGQTATQLARLHVAALHDSGYIGLGVGVCILDEGFNYYRKHTALRHLPIPLTRVRDFVEGDNTVQDTVSNPQFFEHGTWTLSTCGGDAPGIYIGPAYGANFILGRTEDSSSETPIELTNWAMGAEWADSLGADVISSSLGYTTFDPPYPAITYDQLDGHTTVITRAAQIAAAKGIVVVNSAGNSGNFPYPQDKLSAPSDANGDSVLCVAAVDSFNVRAGFSSKGPSYDGRIKPDLAAQGRAVLVADATGDPDAYTRLNGTSFSCPLVAGLAACLIQARPNWPATRIIQALKQTASQEAVPDTLLGWGVPNALAALQWTPDTAGVPPGPSSLRFALQGANPLRAGAGTTAVRFAILSGPPRAVDVRVYDAEGRHVRRLWHGPLAAGIPQVVSWGGEDDSGRALRPGLYVIAFESGTDRSTLRIVVLR